MVEKTLNGRPTAAKKGLMNRNKLQKLVDFLFKILTRTEFIGVENIPSEGGLIMATNHVSRLDIPVLFINPVRPDITALVADKYLDYPFLRWFVTTGGGIWLDRTKADFSAFGQALEALNRGRALGIAPEGTRSETSSLLEGKSGTVLLAHRGRVPIVPIAIFGTEKAIPNLLRLLQEAVRQDRQDLPPAAVLPREPRGGSQTPDRRDYVPYSRLAAGELPWRLRRASALTGTAGRGELMGKPTKN